MKKKNITQLLKIHEMTQELLVELAEGPNADKNLLRKLFEFDHHYLQTAVILNPNTPSELLEEHLKKHSDDNQHNYEERIHIACNPSLRRSVLEKILENDPSKEVREAALTAWAIRIAKNPKSTTKELSGAFEKIDSFKFRWKDRRESALKELFSHKNFPREQIPKGSLNKKHE